eukprot:3387151-Rhodomonas_salina.1
MAADARHRPPVVPTRLAVHRRTRREVALFECQLYFDSVNKSCCTLCCYTMLFLHKEHSTATVQEMLE